MSGLGVGRFTQGWFSRASAAKSDVVAGARHDLQLLPPRVAILPGGVDSVVRSLDLVPQTRVADADAVGPVSQILHFAYVG